MKTLKIVTLAAVVLLACDGAFAYVYGFDPAKMQGDSQWYMELAQNPMAIDSGVYAGKYEYFFDLYIAPTPPSGTTMYFMTLVGLDNSKIANAQTTTPDADAFRTQEWGQPNGYANRGGWSLSPGRLLDFWAKGGNSTLGMATVTNSWRTSYDDGAGGWTDTGLGYAGSSTANPHSYNEYVDYNSFGQLLWKAELAGPGLPIQWQLSNNWFGAEPSEDMIFLIGGNFWATTLEQGLVATVRVVYDEPVDPLTIGWGWDSTKAYPVLGDFTVIPEPATMSLLAIGGLAVLRRRRGK